MANHKSAKKRARQNIVRNARNRARKSQIHRLSKAVLAAIASGNQTEAVTALRAAESGFARTAQKGTLHRRTASRRISRLAQKVAALGKTATATA